MKNLRYLSFFYYYDFEAALLDFKINMVGVVVFVAVNVICTTVGLVNFMKRDIAT